MVLQDKETREAAAVKVGVTGSNKIDVPTLKSTYLFVPNKKYDVTVMIGYKEGALYGSLLLLRYHNLRFVPILYIKKSYFNSRPI